MNRPRVLQVIESETGRGRGIDKDPHRAVVQYHTLDGEFLAEVDPCPDAISFEKDQWQQMFKQDGR